MEGLARSLNSHRTLSQASRATVRWDSPRPCARYPYRTRATRNRVRTVARVGCTTSKNIAVTAPPDSQDLIANWRIIVLRDRARTEPNALPKMIRTNALVLLDSRGPRAPKTSRNVRPPRPAYTGNASTHMDRTRAFANPVTRAKIAGWCTSRAIRRRA